MTETVKGYSPYIYSKEALETNSSNAQSANYILFNQNETTKTGLPVIDNVKQSITTTDGKTIITETDTNGVILKETITEENGNKKIIEYKNGEPYRTSSYTKGGQIKEIISTVNGHEYREIVDEIRQTKTKFIDGKEIKSEKIGNTIAETLFESIKGLGTGFNFNDTINSINADNILEVLEDFAKLSPDESLVQAIMNEGGRGYINNKKDIKFLYEQLKQRAQKLGIETKQLDEDFKNASCMQADGSTNTKDVDVIFNTLIQAIKAKESLTEEEKDIINHHFSKDDSINYLSAVLEKITAAFEEQEKNDGWAAKTSNFLRSIIGSDYTKEQVQAKINEYGEQINILKNSETQEEFEANFEKIFGVKYDEELILSSVEKELKLSWASGLMKSKDITIENTKAFLEFNKDDYSEKYIPSDIGYTVEENNIEQDYINAETKLAEYLGDGNIEQGRKDILELILKPQGLNENSSTIEKFEAIQTYFRELVQEIDSSILEYTDGLGFEKYEEDIVNAAYSAAYGTKNDLPRLTHKYIRLQIEGEKDIKNIAKFVAVTGVVLSGGSTAVVAGAAGGISFAVDASDSLSSEVGIQDGELGEFAGNALLTAATTYGMGKLFHALKLGKFKMTEHATTTGTEHGIHGLIHPHGAEHPILNAANLRNLTLRAI